MPETSFPLPRYPLYGTDADELHTLVTTNNPPTTAQSLYCRDTILPTIASDLEKVEGQTREAEKQIRELQKKILSLESKGKVIRASKASLENVLSPARSIPVEIWHEIFRHVTMLTADIPDIPRPLCTISEVCTAWRSVVMSSQVLWSKLTVWISACDTLDYSDLRYLDAAIRRSGNRPLSIMIHDDLWDTGRGGAAMGAGQLAIYASLTSSLFSQAHRWREADLRVALGNTTPIYSAIKSLQDVGALERLTLTFLGELYPFDSILDARDLGLFGTAPRLRDVVLTDALRVDERHPPLLPWAQIRSLTVNQEWFSQAQIDLTALMFSRCADLQHLVCLGHDYRDYRRPPEPHTHIVPPFRSPITFLHTCLKDLIDLLVVPDLQEAVIRGSADDDGHGMNRSSTLPRFIQMVRRSNCALSLTRIEGSKPYVRNGDTFELLALLHETVNLEVLVLREETYNLDELGYDCEFVELIRSLETAPVTFLPKLRCLVLDELLLTTRAVLPYFGGVGHIGRILEARVPRLSRFRIGVVVEVQRPRMHNLKSDSMSEEFERVAGSGELTRAALEREEVEVLERFMERGLKLHLEICEEGHKPHFVVGQRFD